MGPVHPSICKIMKIVFYKKFLTYKLCEYRDHLFNQAGGPWNPDGWNYYENTFFVDDKLKARERFFIFLHGVMPGDSYMVDDISVTPVQH